MSIPDGSTPEINQNLLSEQIQQVLIIDAEPICCEIREFTKEIKKLNKILKEIAKTKGITAF